MSKGTSPRHWLSNRLKRRGFTSLPTAGSQKLEPSARMKKGKEGASIKEKSASESLFC